MRGKLIALRKEKGFTRKTIAEELKITESFYGKIERGNRNPTLELAKSISKLLGANSIDELFFNNGEENKVIVAK